jgi:hypothetical protein
MIFDNLQREKVSKREGYLCLICPAYRSSPVYINIKETLKMSALYTQSISTSKRRSSRKHWQSSSDVPKAFQSQGQPMQSNFDKREGTKHPSISRLQNNPAFRFVKVAHSACETSQNAPKTSRISVLSRLRLARLSNLTISRWEKRIPMPHTDAENGEFAGSLNSSVAYNFKLLYDPPLIPEHPKPIRPPSKSRRSTVHKSPVR